MTKIEAWYLFNNFIEIKFTNHIIHSFKVYSSVACYIFESYATVIANSRPCHSSLPLPPPPPPTYHRIIIYKVLVCGFLHFVYFQGSFILWLVSLLHSFLWPNIILMYGCATFYLFVRLLVYIWVISTVWLVWIVLLLTFMCKFLNEICFPFFCLYTQEWNCSII